MDVTEPSERWAVDLEGPLTTPTVVGDTVYVSRGAPTDGAPVATVEVFALDSGEKRWSQGLDTVAAVGTDGTRLWRTSRDGGAVVHPAVADGTVFVAGLKGTIAAYDLDSGKRLWKTTVDADAEQQATILSVTNGAVHVVRVGDGSATVRAFDWETGEIQWTLTRTATRARGPIPVHGAHLLSTSRPPQKQRNEGTIAEGQDTESTLYAFSA